MNWKTCSVEAGDGIGKLSLDLRRLPAVYQPDIGMQEDGVDDVRFCLLYL